MKCPYCAEEIQDDARTCRYCRQDLSVVRELVQENEQLREKVDSLESKIYQGTFPTNDPPYQSEASNGAPPPSVSHRGSLLSRRRLLAVLMGFLGVVAGLIAFNSFETNGFTPNYTYSFVVVLGAPFFAGLWAGVKELRRDLTSYTQLGLTLGALSGIVAATMVYSAEGVPPAGLLIGYVAFMVIFATMTAPLFISGGWFGILISRFRSHDMSESTTSQRRVVRKLSGPEGELSRTILLLIQSLGPAALALIGTIITALVTLQKA